MRRLKFLLNDTRLTLHWRAIGKLRRAAALLIEGGANGSHPMLVWYSNEILRHGMVVSRIWNSQKRYAPYQLEIDNEKPQQVNTISA